MGAPGVTFETVDLTRPRVERLRTDICGFLGYAERGPIDRPVKLTSWRQFLDAFGPPLSAAHTGHSVRLFFENGGVACYMQRLADPDRARAASVLIDLGKTGTGLWLQAGFSAISATVTRHGGPTGTAPGASGPSPGGWANRLSVIVQPGGSSATQSLPNQPPDGSTLRLASVAGLAPGSWVRLVQDGDAMDRLGRIALVDAQLSEVAFTPALAGLPLDFSRPVRVEPQEFTLVVLLDGVEVERHANLSLDGGHPRFVPLILGAESRFLAAKVTLDPALLSVRANWPVPGQPIGLLGGRDGLVSLTKAHVLEALAKLGLIDEIAVLSAPDIVLAYSGEVEPLSDPLPYFPCRSLDPPPVGVLNGIVLDAETGEPLVRARVTSRDGPAPAVLTDGLGRFVLRGLAEGQAAIRIEMPGWVAMEASGQAFPAVMPLAQRFSLAPRAAPPAFTDDEVFEVQSAMAAQGRNGGYRVALLDVPVSALRTLSALQAWRMRFDTSHAALYWPWVLAADPAASGGVRLMPPSGVVAGLLARLDVAEGPQRAPANRPLRGLTGVSAAVDSERHGVLNDLGINVLRAYPGRGIAPQGARTLSSDPAWRYLGVRRLMMMIAKAIEQSHQWAVFEPNDRPLRDAITQSLGAFLGALWRRGAFAGPTPETSFAVKCDAENNPSAVIDAGQLVAEIAVAPVRPAEFIRLRLGRIDRLSVQVEEGQ
ncbi:MAG: phage tail sheath subtilisin-like domain-containing protein [Rhodobacterales bacterium]|nr:phage tail sheath subtilisin-like domain-containing protein [Rhodobacterales bacterium]